MEEEEGGDARVAAAAGGREGDEPTPLDSAIGPLPLVVRGCHWHVFWMRVWLAAACLLGFVWRVGSVGRLIHRVIMMMIGGRLSGSGQFERTGPRHDFPLCVWVERMDGRMGKSRCGWMDRSIDRCGGLWVAAGSNETKRVGSLSMGLQRPAGRRSARQLQPVFRRRSSSQNICCCHGRGARALSSAAGSRATRSKSID